MLRLFVAIALPRSVRERLAAFAGGVPGARWTPVDNLHLTLRFIGNVENGVAWDIDDALQSVQVPDFDLTLRGVGHFGKARMARVLWAGVERSEPLTRLQSKIETALAGAGIAREERKFSPHVTLARLKGAPAARVSRFVAEHGDFVAGPVPVREFVLYSSFLSASGAIHTPEASYPLAVAAAS